MAGSGASVLDYDGSGVNIDAGNEAVRRIRALVATTRRPEQLDELGGFAGMIELPAGMRQPVLVACTDGVGTKILVAIAMGRHDTVGIDLVAMSVNDLLCTGAQTLYLLDYIATGKLEPDHIEQIVSGVAAGCRAAGCALLGGETAELPGMYAPGHYDLAAAATGVVERDSILGPARVGLGDSILALPSSGIHSNGYSLARRALLDPEFGGFALDDPLPGTEGSVGDALLEPTRIYENAFAAMRDLDGAPLHAAANITGGGLIENPPRALTPEMAARLDLTDVPSPAVMNAIADQGVATPEMLRTFNCGVGMLLFVDRERVDDLRAALEVRGEPCIEVGTVVERGAGTGVEISGR
jgi:phosphoribosylformylglycinamidine cyclo-ligase